MVIVITGAISIGKTTVCRKLVEIAQQQGYTCAGIFSYKAADKGIIIEDIQSGERENLASIGNLYNGPRTERYHFNPEGINFGIEAIRRGTGADILSVDEVGQLELRGEGFAEVLGLLKSGEVRNCVLVVRKELLSAFLPHLPHTPLVFETTVNNRNHLPQQIGSLLVEKLREESRAY